MIDSRLKRFIFKIVVAALAMTVLATVLFLFVVPGHYIAVLPWMLVFFTILSILIHGYQLSLAGKDMGKFARSNMIISMLRLLIYSLFAIGYLVLDGKNVSVFIVSLVVIYLVYTIIDIKDTTRMMQQK